MKKTMLFTGIFCFFALAIPGPRLFADIGFGGRIDVGLDLFAVPASATTEEDGMSIMPLIPLIDAGIFGQFNFGLVNLGAGLRGVSIVVINAFWPSLYAELNLWRFTLNAQIGGGLFYVFPIFLMAGPYFIPELSLWYTVKSFNNGNNLRLGIGCITAISPQSLDGEMFREIYDNSHNNFIFYLAFKASFNSFGKT